MAEQTPETNPAQAQQPEQQPETQQPEQQTAIDLNALQSQLAAAQQLSDMQSKGDPITDLHENLAADEAYGYRQRLKEFKILYLK